MKIHKIGSDKIAKYVAFGQYEFTLTPLCVGGKMLYKGFSFLVSHFWRNVTCKHCLKMRKENKK